MPELPDLVYLETKLAEYLSGREILAIKVKQPVVLRILLQEGFEKALTRTRFTKIHRHGPFMNFGFENDCELVIHPMLAGRFMYAAQDANTGKGLCFSLYLDNGAALHYLDDKKMGKAYLIPAGRYEQIPRYSQQGVNILSSDFTLACFRKLIAGQRKQVRVFLMDQTRLSAIGNCYADEILFDGRIHPKTFCNQLAPEEVDRLHQSINTVIAWGIAEVERAQQPLEVKVRSHVKVRNKKDMPCPRCQTTIRRAGVLGYDTFFCPVCQPAKRAQFIDWS